MRSHRACTTAPLPAEPLTQHNNFKRHACGLGEVECASVLILSTRKGLHIQARTHVPECSLLSTREDSKSLSLNNATDK